MVSSGGSKGPHSPLGPGRRKSKTARYLWSAAGTLLLAIGIVGVAVPILPTTPLLLLAAACYMRGSERMHRWLMDNRVLGQYLKNYTEGRGIPMGFKISTIALLWAMILFTAFAVLSDTVIRVILVIVAILVTAHIARIKTLSTRNDPSEL